MKDCFYVPYIANEIVLVDWQEGEKRQEERERSILIYRVFEKRYYLNKSGYLVYLLRYLIKFFIAC